MCHFQQLYYHESIGYALRCRQCRTLQIGFGNMMITLEEQALPDFHQMLRTIARERKDLPDTCLRNIQVPLPYAGISLIVSKNELLTFIQMLDSADTELQSIAMLALFQGQEDE